MKKVASIRIEQDLWNLAQKKIEENKGKMILPDNFSTMVQVALVAYLQKAENKK